MNDLRNFVAGRMSMYIVCLMLYQLGTAQFVILAQSLHKVVSVVL